MLDSPGWSTYLYIVDNRVRELRTRQGLSQAEIAAELGVSRQTVIAIESGRYSPSLPLAFRIARFFGSTVDELFDPSAPQAGAGGRQAGAGAGAGRKRDATGEGRPGNRSAPGAEPTAAGHATTGDPDMRVRATSGSETTTDKEER